MFPIQSNLKHLQANRDCSAGEKEGVVDRVCESIESRLFWTWYNTPVVIR